MCMEQCFDSFEAVAPHHRLAQACLHSACRQKGLDCFADCTDHVANHVPRDDWATWAALLAATPACHNDNVDNVDKMGDAAKEEAALEVPSHLQQSVLSCADYALWSSLTQSSVLSKDVQLLCLNALCDYDVKCAKQCLLHVTREISEADLPVWHKCTYARPCANIEAYANRERCADKCLHDHKQALRDAQRREEQQRRAKETGALLQAANKAHLIKGINEMGLVLALICVFWGV